MQSDDHTVDSDTFESFGRTLGRRQLLAALGIACVPAVAGCAGSSSDSTPTDTPQGAAPTDTQTATPTETPMSATDTPTDQPSQTIDRRFGYVATAGSTPAVEADHTVTLLIRPRENVPVPEFYFEPTGLRVDVGDTVKFDMTTPHHNVNAFHPAFGYTQRVPEGVPAFSSPVLSGGDAWYYTFDTEGVHDFACAPHELFGMVGRVVVGSPTGPAANPVGEAPAPSERSRSPELNAGAVLSDPAMAPDAIDEAGSVSWGAIAAKAKRPMIRIVEPDGE